MSQLLYILKFTCSISCYYKKQSANPAAAARGICKSRCGKDDLLNLKPSLRMRKKGDFKLCSQCRFKCSILIFLLTFGLFEWLFHYNLSMTTIELDSCFTRSEETCSCLLQKLWAKKNT